MNEMTDVSLFRVWNHCSAIGILGFMEYPGNRERRLVLLVAKPFSSGFFLCLGLGIWRRIQKQVVDKGKMKSFFHRDQSPKRFRLIFAGLPLWVGSQCRPSVFRSERNSDCCISQRANPAKNGRIFQKAFQEMGVEVHSAYGRPTSRSRRTFHRTTFVGRSSI